MHFNMEELHQNSFCSDKSPKLHFPPKSFTCGFYLPLTLLILSKPFCAIVDQGVFLCGIVLGYRFGFENGRVLKIPSLGLYVQAGTATGPLPLLAGTGLFIALFLASELAYQCVFMQGRALRPYKTVV